MVALAQTNELAELLERDAATNDAEPRVSLYMPTHRAGQEIRQDAIRLKNLLNAAEEQLVEFGVRRPDARRHLEPARRLVEDGDFWRHRDLGLALFIINMADDRDHALQYWDLPYPVAEQMRVHRQLALRPLMPRFRPGVAGNRRYYVLVLSQGRIQLYAAVNDHLEPIDLPDAPDGIEELQAFIDTEKSLQFHTRTGSSMNAGGNRRAMFHGHGSDDARENNRVVELFRLLDESLSRVLEGQNAPLIPVGVQWVVGAFREITSYPHVTEQYVPGSTRHRTEHELFVEANNIAEQVFNQHFQRSLALYDQQRGTPGATCILQRVVEMALGGQVHSLLVALDADAWGAADPETGNVTVQDKPNPSDENLLETAVIHTLRHGGDVTVIPQEQMPERAMAAAVLRRGAVAMNPNRI